MMFNIRSFVIIIAFVSLHCAGYAPAHADLGDQLFKLLPDDGATNDAFGWSVAVTGTTAVVGTPWDDDNGAESGSAYLFDINTGQQLCKLVPVGGAEFDEFGRSVAISGTTAIVGAFGDDDNGATSGSAYLFDTTTGQQLFKLLPDDGATFDEFGLYVAISSTTAIVGSFRDDDNGCMSGSAYLFDTTTGKQLFKLLPKDGAAGDRFGRSVSINGPPGNEVAIVGAYWDDDNGNKSGSAYLFDVTTGQQIAKLLPKDGAADDIFGWSVAISGPPESQVAIVGAPDDDDNGVDSGSAYLFDISDPVNPTQIAKLLAHDGAADDSFGNSIAISGTTAIVGATKDNDNGTDSGSAYLFDTTTGKQIVKLLPSDGALDDRFGFYVAISETIAIVGARYDDDNGSKSGSAYLFDATAPGKCLGDLDDSSDIGVKDLLILLASWGPCEGCPADFDDSGDVGVKDLLVLLGNWGPCP